MRGVYCLDMKTGQAFEIRAKQVINAAGIWGQQICEYGDLSIKMFPAKGSLLILDYRINNLVINRCRKPSDADILVPWRYHFSYRYHFRADRLQTRLMICM